MSLRGFHIVFIIASIILSFFFGWWLARQYGQTQITSYLITSIFCYLATAGLIFYIIRFVKKVKN